MSKVVPMTNKRFGRLTVICKDERDSSTREYWYKCKCDCGRVISVRGTSLRRGITKSCGCIRNEMLIKRNKNIDEKHNLLGKRFNRLLVIKQTSDRKNGQRVWQCRCDCNKIHFATTSHLINGSVKSCGCMPKNSPQNLIGKRYGRLEVIRALDDRKANGGAVWQCRCDCNNEVKVSASNLKRGATKSCGCIRRDDLTGKKYGKLTVIKLGNKSGYGNGSFWICRCDCGNLCEVHASKLKTGHTSSCGCAHSDLQNDLAGMKFGRLTVLEDSMKRRRGSGGTIWKCKCDCGAIKLVRQDSLVSGKVQSCGCVKSRGNKKIAEILRENNIEHIPEYCPKDISGRYRFDFAVVKDAKIEYFIEYDGELHYKYNGKGWNTEERFQRTLKSDRIKNDYCKNKGISLIRIPFTAFGELTIDDIMLKTSKYIYIQEENSTFK